MLAVCVEPLEQRGCRLEILNLQEILIEGYLVLLQKEELRDPVEESCCVAIGRDKDMTHRLRFT